MPITFNELTNPGFRYRPAPGTSLVVRSFPEAASADFKEGEPVILSSSGGVDSVTQLATAPSAGAISSSVSENQKILGWAKRSATGTTGTPIPILLARNAQVLMRIYNATAGNSELRDTTPGDLAELFRYKEAAAVGTGIFPVCSAAPNATDGINSVKIIEYYTPDWSSTNALLGGEQAVDSDYGLVWVEVRLTLAVN